MAYCTNIIVYGNFPFQEYESFDVDGCIIDLKGMHISTFLKNLEKNIGEHQLEEFQSFEQQGLIHRLDEEDEMDENHRQKMVTYRVWMATKDRVSI